MHAACEASSEGMNLMAGCPEIRCPSLKRGRTRALREGAPKLNPSEDIYAYINNANLPSPHSQQRSVTKVNLFIYLFIYSSTYSFIHKFHEHSLVSTPH
jgi:hypothetical protein